MLEHNHLIRTYTMFNSHGKVVLSLVSKACRNISKFFFIILRVLSVHIRNTTQKKSLYFQSGCTQKYKYWYQNINKTKIRDIRLKKYIEVELEMLCQSFSDAIFHIRN